MKKLKPVVVVEIRPIFPSGINSTLFTQCCGAAIRDTEGSCPSCGKNVVGHDLPMVERVKRRWRSATRLWRRAGGRRG